MVQAKRYKNDSTWAAPALAGSKWSKWSKHFFKLLENDKKGTLPCHHNACVVICAKSLAHLDHLDQANTGAAHVLQK